jgi:hypothetical protein
VSTKLFGAVVYPCQHLVAVYDSYSCPSEGLYDFTITYQTPSSGSSWLFSTGAGIYVTLDFENTDHEFTKCSMYVTPQSSSSSSSWAYYASYGTKRRFVRWGMGGVSVLVMGLAGYYFRSTRRSLALRDETLLDPETHVEMMEDPRADVAIQQVQ